MAQEKLKRFQDNSCLWSIEEAEIGDILTASDKSIFIYAGLNGVLAQSYIALLADGYLNTMKCNWEEKTSVVPATNEQRNLLLCKMKEAGYVWDVDKKELKKINEKDMTQESVTQRVAELLRLHGFDGDYSAPTFQEANDWLETKGYWIVCRPLNDGRIDIYIYATNDGLEWYPFKNFVTPTKYEGFNMALEYILENLI